MKKFINVLILILFILTFNLAIAKEISQPVTKKAETLDFPVLTIGEFLKSMPENYIIAPLEGQTSIDVSGYKKITLQGAIEYALANNLKIQSNRLEENISKNNIKKANSFRNPFLQSYFNFGTASIDNPNTFGLVLPVEIAKRRARKNLAVSQLDLTKGDIAFSEYDLKLSVRSAYVNLVAAKTQLSILEENRVELQELLNIAQKRYKAKKVSEMDLIQAKMALNKLLIQINLATKEIQVARYNLNKLLNSKYYDSEEEKLPSNDNFSVLLTPNPKEAVPSFEELFNVALKKRIDLQNAKKEIEIAQKNLIVVARQRIPDIEVGGGYMFVSSALSTKDSITSGAYVGANLTNIPLFYQYSPEIKNAKIKIEQKKLDYEFLKKQARTNLHSAYDEFTTAQNNLNYYNKALLNESEQFLEIAKQNYQKGKTEITDFIIVQQTYKSIKMEYTVALLNYYGSWVNILREVNEEQPQVNL